MAVIRRAVGPLSRHHFRPGAPHVGFCCGEWLQNPLQGSRHEQWPLLCNSYRTKVKVLRIVKNDFEEMDSEAEEALAGQAGPAEVALNAGGPWLSMDRRCGGCVTGRWRFCGPKESSFNKGLSFSNLGLLHTK